MPHVRIIHQKGVWEKLMYLEPTDESKIRNTKIKYNVTFYIKSVDDFIKLFTTSDLGKHTNLKNNRTCEKGGEIYQNKLKKNFLDLVNQSNPDGYHFRFVGFFIDNNLKEGHSCEIIYSTQKNPKPGQYVRDELVINLHLKFHDGKSPLNMVSNLQTLIKVFIALCSQAGAIKKMNLKSTYPEHGFDIANHHKSIEALKSYKRALTAKEFEKETIDAFARIPSDLFTCASFK